MRCTAMTYLLRHARRRPAPHRAAHACVRQPPRRRSRQRQRPPRREASPRDRHRAGHRSRAAAPRRADRGHEPGGDRRDDAAHPGAGHRPHGDPGRAQDEGRHEDLRPHHRAASGPGAGRGLARRDPRQHPGPADLPGGDPVTGDLLVLEDVHTYYGEAHILQGISLTVRQGEVVTIIGRNGAGKTTTLRSIMGIAQPRRGRILLRGQDLTGMPTHQIARKGIAWVPEERRILPNLTVLDNLRLGWLATDGGGPDRAAEVFEYFPRLRERIAHRGRHLSGGEQQMLAIARALVARPSIMLVDEPTEGLAPMLVQSLTDILAVINRRGTTILLVEQALEVALTLAQRVYVMDQGRVQFEGTPDDLRRDPEIQQRFLGV